MVEGALGSSVMQGGDSSGSICHPAAHKFQRNRFTEALCVSPAASSRASHMDDVRLLQES